MLYRNSPKLHKGLGQHFLKDREMARNIVACLPNPTHYKTIMEIGPGHGALTDWLSRLHAKSLYLVEIDSRFIPFLEKRYSGPAIHILAANFLELPLDGLLSFPSAIVSNLPYNISSQILLKIVHHRNAIQEVICTLQQEVAERIASSPDSKSYGVLSVLLQAFYQVRYCFTVPPAAFTPPPKVTSGVLHLSQKRTHLPCDEKLFFQIVRTSFQQRRKMLRNGLALFQKRFGNIPASLLEKRPENLSVEDFIYLTQKISIC